MLKLLKNCKNIIIGISEGIQLFREYKVGKVK
jgi:hypothetical protein